MAPPYPWMKDVKHLGNILQCDNTFSRDCDIKRGQFIGKVHSLLQELHFASPAFIMKMYFIYCSTFYASSLWNLFGVSCERIYAAWNTACRIAFNVPRTTHRYLIETISGCVHPKVFLSSRFVKYHLILINCNKSPIRLLANVSKNDLRTVYGSNLHNISVECDTPVDKLNPCTVKATMEYFKTPVGEEWRHNVLKELLDDTVEIYGLERTEKHQFINFLCTT